MLFRLAHLELRADLAEEEVELRRQSLARMAAADSVAWVIVANVRTSAQAAGGSDRTGFLIAFAGDADFRRWCVNEPLHLDCSDYIMPRCEGGLRDLLTSARQDDGRPGS
jgi:hypothetical protein